ncbi:MAG: DUF2786 domain-containing protein [Alphaproteobacteria bacterium]|nr:DUF2786 domain-containing protein [Alphaproteobacteria bacterium]
MSVILIESFFTEALAALPPKLIEETAHQWLSKAGLADVTRKTLLLAGSLLLFSPSLTGSTPVDRYVNQRARTADKDQRPALEALRRARFRLLRPISQSGQRLMTVDMGSGEQLSLRNLPRAMGVPAVAARLVPLPDGDFMVIGAVLKLDPELTDIALSFLREGKGLTNPQRCAAALYRHAVRHTHLCDDPDDDETVQDRSARRPPPPPPEATPVDQLDELAFAFAALKPGQEPDSRLIASARRELTSSGTLRTAVSRSLRWRRSRPDLSTGFERVALLIMETMERRASIGSGDTTPLARIAIDMEILVTGGQLPREALELFQNLRLRVSVTRHDGAGANSEELARVLLRIQALRAKTVDRGCTEQEALAAAKKVATLLDQYGLSLGEVELRDQPCEGVGIETQRRRHMPVDDCVPAIANFCDCRVWREQPSEGTIRHVFFGLRADVEAAHYLHDLIEITFRTETWIFRQHAEAEVARERRRTAHSFQVGLANGISEKLRKIKDERNTAMRSSGRDLVPIKAGVIKDELDKLGMNFQSTSRRRRLVDSEAFSAGQAAGRRFEPHAAVRDGSGA